MTAYLCTTALCTWTGSLLALEAAVELPARVVDGRLLNGLWICNDPDDRFLFASKVAAVASGYLSVRAPLTRWAPRQAALAPRMSSR